MIKINRKTGIILHDFVMVVIAWQAAWWVRFNLDFPFFNWQLSLYTLPLVLLIQGLVFQRFRLYRGIWRFASLPDLWNIFRAAILGALFITLVLFIWFRLEGVPRSILVLYPVFLIFLLGGPRLGYRLWKDHSLNLRTITGKDRVLIIGAGRAGEMLVRDMLRDVQYIPVGFVDDNPELRHSEIQGIRVLGNTDELGDIVRQREIDLIVIAIPSATNSQMRRIVESCEELDIPMRTLPRLRDMVSGGAAMNDLRDVSIEDLLGRDKVDLDWHVIQQGLTNKTVLVSGGGGSIGSELCMQISQVNPASLIILERSEFNLYRIQNQLAKLYPSLKLTGLLGDLCDRDMVEHLLMQYKPDVIFHAAAYKHVPILQQQLREAVRNNILGTKNLAESASKLGCEKFVLISTDKAVNPVNILGATKRVAEMYCEWMNQKSSTRFITVRFGNVLDSDGSVVPLFREQIGEGGPVTVTHPEITRYFMTLQEAAQLILQASAMGKGGEIFVLDMGNPVKIRYLAEQMIRLSGRIPGQDVTIEFTGLRPGEKLFEELFYENENQDATSHPKILLARHSDMDWASLNQAINDLEQACLEFNDNRLQSLLDSLVPVAAYQQQDNIIPLNRETGDAGNS